MCQPMVFPHGFQDALDTSTMLSILPTSSTAAVNDKTLLRLCIHKWGEKRGKVPMSRGVKVWI